MIRVIATGCIFFLQMNFASAQLPFKYDSLFKTIYAKDLCKLIQIKPDILLTITNNMFPLFTLVHPTSHWYNT